MRQLQNNLSNWQELPGSSGNLTQKATPFPRVAGRSPNAFAAAAGGNQKPAISAYPNNPCVPICARIRVCCDAKRCGEVGSNATFTTKTQVKREILPTCGNRVEGFSPIRETSEYLISRQTGTVSRNAQPKTDSHRYGRPNPARIRAHVVWGRNRLYPREPNRRNSVTTFADIKGRHVFGC